MLKVPRDFQIEAMAAIGRPGQKEELPIGLQEPESPNDRRKISRADYGRSLAVGTSENAHNALTRIFREKCA
jgi:hypothetical protein